MVGFPQQLHLRAPSQTHPCQVTDHNTLFLSSWHSRYRVFCWFTHKPILDVAETIIQPAFSYIPSVWAVLSIVKGLERICQMSE